MEIINFEKMPSAMMQVLERLGRIETMLMKPTEPPKPQRFDFNGALAHFKEKGCAMSKSQLQKFSASGRVPCRKFNGRLIFDRIDVDNWIESQMIKGCDNSEAAALTLARSANRKLRGGQRL